MNNPYGMYVHRAIKVSTAPSLAPKIQNNTDYIPDNYHFRTILELCIARKLRCLAYSQNLTISLPESDLFVTGAKLVRTLKKILEVYNFFSFLLIMLRMPC